MESALIASIVVLVDQATKVAVVRWLPIGERLAVLGDLLRLTHVRNPGAVFGIMRSSGTYFTVFSMVAAGIILAILFFSKKASAVVRFGLGLVLGGAIGNLIDRLRFGAVVDFIDIGVGERIRWPSFNIADFAITVGVLLLLGSTLRSQRQC